MLISWMSSGISRTRNQPDADKYERRAQQLPHCEPAERQIANVGVRLAHQLHGAAEDAVQQGEQAGNQSFSAFAGGHDPQDCEQDNTLQDGFI